MTNVVCGAPILLLSLVVQMDSLSYICKLSRVSPLLRSSITDISCFHCALLVARVIDSTGCSPVARCQPTMAPIDEIRNNKNSQSKAGAVNQLPPGSRPHHNPRNEPLILAHVGSMFGALEDKNQTNSHINFPSTYQELELPSQLNISPLPHSTETKSCSPTSRNLEVDGTTPNHAAIAETQGRVNTRQHEISRPWQRKGSRERVKAKKASECAPLRRWEKEGIEEQAWNGVVEIGLASDREERLRPVNRPFGLLTRSQSDDSWDKCSSSAGSPGSWHVVQRSSC